MKQITINKSTNALAELVKAAQAEPVVLMDGKSPQGVFLSMDDMRGLEDFLDFQAAQKAHEKGYVGVEASHALTKKFMNADS